MVPEKFAVMAVDPGGTTGLASALLNAERARTTRALMKRAVRKGALEVEQIGSAGDPGPHGGPAHQAAQVYKRWLAFQSRAHAAGVPFGAIFLVIEEFALRQRSADLAPVAVTNALLAYLRGEGGTWAGIVRPDLLYFQQPSEAMTYATNDRLKAWGIWTVAQEHGRDATRHLALRASKILDGEGVDAVY